MKTFTHKNGRELIVLEAERKAIAVPKESFDRDFDPNYTDVKNVTVISDIVRVEAEPFPPFDSCNPARVKDAVGFDNRFLVTDQGDVLSKATDKIISTRINYKGYEAFATYVGGKGGKAYCPRVHRIVATAFVSNPEDKPQVNHIDGVKTNNVYSNLEWCTNQENQIHARDNGLIEYAVGVNGSAAKLNESQVREIRQLLADGKETLRAIGNRYDLAHQQIMHLRDGKTYSSVI